MLSGWPSSRHFFWPLVIVPRSDAKTESPPPVTAPARPTLSDVLTQAFTPFEARTAVYVKHLTTGEEAGIRADDAFNSFSVIKLGIMLRAYALANSGQLNLDARVSVSESASRFCCRT